MAFLSFLKKKPATQESLDLPPPPAPETAMQPAEVRIVNELPEMEQMPEQPLAEPPAEQVPESMELPMQAPEEHEEAPEEEAAPAAPAPEISISKPRREPLFVSVDNYQDVLNSINYIRGKLGEADELVNKLNDIKAVEEKSFEAWRNQLEDVQRKLAYVENVVFEAGV